MGLLYNRVWKEEKEKKSGNFVLISRLDLQRNIVSSIEEQRFRCAVETAICSSYEVIYLFWRMRAIIDHPSTDSFVKKITQDRILSVQNYHSSYKRSFKINYNHSSGLSPPSSNKISRYHLFHPRFRNYLSPSIRYLQQIQSRFPADKSPITAREYDGENCATPAIDS